MRGELMVEIPVERAQRLRECNLKVLQNDVVSWAHAKGWYEREVPFLEAMMLIVTEVSEAGEAYRIRGMEEYADDTGKPDDVGSEFADVLIRLLNYCDRYGVDLVREFHRKMEYNWKRDYRHGGKLA
jgi:NTP pyrophosphatase (non-canonical NTP hydrolase)